jgi:hypothetical protein
MDMVTVVSVATHARDRGARRCLYVDQTLTRVRSERYGT